LGKELPSSFRPVLGSKLPEPIFDPTTKSEEHDRPIDRRRVVSSGILSDNDYDFLERTSLSLYKKMSNIVERAGFIIADVKFEFGVDEKGSILLGDSLGPDEYRLWLKSRYQPGKIQESYDKQLLRDWLIEIGFKGTIDRLAMEGKKPEPLQISSPVVNELSRRYIHFRIGFSQFLLVCKVESTVIRLRSDSWHWVHYVLLGCLLDCYHIIDNIIIELRPFVSNSL
jgi:phosphoribosylaminoimidazole-succinocarboxamide synthase